MKVLHVFKITGISGSENHLLTLLPGLVKKGVKIQVVMMEEPGKPVVKFAEILENSGIEVFRVAIGLDLSVPVFFKIRKIIANQKPDIVHTHLIHGDLYGGLAARSAGIKRIVSSKHNDDEFRNRFFMKSINRFINHRTCRIIAISNAMKEFSIRNEGIDPGKIEVIHYGLVDFEKSLRDKNLRKKLGYGPEHIVFGIIARLTKQKGHRYLLEAFARVQSRHDCARLLIAGDGEMRGELERITRKLGLEKKVKFLGIREDTADIYHVLDIFVHPSLWEGFGLVFLEAMSFSLPIIATKVSAIPELVEDGGNGILVMPQNSHVLEKAMLDLIENPEKRLRLGKTGKKRLRAIFGVDNMVEKVFDVYEKV
jgi:glycosyltransferase involved in cell wall biosynthesis